MKENLPGLSPLTSAVNKLFHGKEPWQISAITAVTVLTGFWLWDVFESGNICERVKERIFHLMKKIPTVSKKIEAERQKVYELFKKEVISRSEGLTYVVTLPEKAKNPDEILNLVKIHLAAGKYAWKDGYVSGSVYYHDETLMDLVGEVNKLSVYTNPLHPDVFPGVCKMEAEVIKIIANLFHGGAEACGAMTSGGTESIMMACKAYRDYGLRERGIENPEMVIPVTAHAAFEKAGSYLKIRVKHIAVDSDSTCVNIRAMERAISKNTIMLVGSTPNFPYGTMDDIEQISRLGKKYGIPVHVDCCLGSFVAAFKRDLGYDVPPFDFSLPGVTSMSVDTHKYGFAPKGSSVVLYSELKYRHHQYFASLSWPGGLYGSPSVSGSRSGAIIASCWATLMYFGVDGYRNTVQKILSVAEYIEEELRTVDGIFIFGKPFSTVIALGSKKFHIYRLSQALNEKSWNLNMLQFPFGIHICLTQLHTLPGVADRFINDVKEAVKKILESPNDDLEGKVAMYGMSSALPDRSIVGDFTKSYLDAIYYTPKKDA